MHCLVLKYLLANLFVCISNVIALNILNFDRVKNREWHSRKFPYNAMEI